MTNDYPTEQQARERALADILWQITVDGNAERAERVRRQATPDYRLEDLRAKLTSWPALLFKRYEVARALALGWWYQLTPKEQGSIIDFTAVIVSGSVVVLVFIWMAVR